MRFPITLLSRPMILLAILVLSLLAVWSITRVMGGIQQARLANVAVQSLELSFEDIEDGSLDDIASLQGRVAFINSQLDTAHDRLTPFIHIAPFLGWVPKFGTRLHSSQEILYLGINLAQASQNLLIAIEIATFQAHQTSEQILIGNRFNENVLGSLEMAEPFFSRALTHLEKASSIIETLENRDLPTSFKNIVASAKAITPDLEKFAYTGMSMPQLWKGFLGYDETRSYLLVAQNSDELRAAGGFIPGAWILTLNHGEIVEIRFWDTVDVDDLSAKPPIPPEGLLQTLWAGAWLFRDASWYPDFPTSARIMEQIFELGQEISVDGTIAIDQWAFKTIIDTIGPITLSTGEILESESYLQTLETQTDLYGRGFIDTTLEAILDRLREHGNNQNLIALLAAINKSFNEKHLMVSLHDETLQNAASRNGWTGAIDPRSGDYLMVVNSNVGFSKVNRNIGQSITYTVNLDDIDKPEARLDILYTNRSSKVTPNQCDIQASGRAGTSYEQQKNTCYWDYLRVYAPMDSVLNSSSPFPMPQGALYRQIGYDDIEDTSRTYIESDKSVFAGYFNLEVGKSKKIAFEYTLPDRVIQREKDRLSYNLFLQKQPGTTSTPAEVNIHLPTGYCVLSSSQAIVHLEDGEVRFTLNLNTDTVLEITLEPRTDCRLSDEDPQFTMVDLPKGIVKTSFGSVIVEHPTPGSALARIQISPENTTLVRGQRFLFTAVALDTDGEPMQDIQINWRVRNQSAGIISTSGLFTASSLSGIYPEVLEVSATSPKGNAVASTTIEIVTSAEAEERLLDSVIVYPSDITVRPSQTIGLSALGWDKRSRFVQNLRFQWRMEDPRAGSINQFGFFKASTSPGHYPDAIQVTVSQDTPEGPRDSLALASVTVSEAARLNELKHVVIIPYRAFLTQGQNINLIARALNSSGHHMREVEFTWKVNQPTAGIMTKPGVFVAGNESGLYPDAIEVIATQHTSDGTVYAKANIPVTVITPRVVGNLASTQLVPSDVTLIPRQRIIFNAFGMDADGNPIQGKIEWEIVEPNAGSINDAGVFRAGSQPGSYKNAILIRMIQEKNDEKIVLQTHASVNIIGPLHSLSVSTPVTTLEAGRSARMLADGYDTNGFVVPFLQLRWSLVDSDVGNITPSGFFTAGSKPGSYENAIKVVAVELDTN